MDNELYEDEKVPYGVLTSITFNVLTQKDTENISVISLESANDVTHRMLGLPNPSSECVTCGAKDIKFCEGHLGHIQFPYTILHPYFLAEVAQILNKICPACKSIRKNVKAKGSNGHQEPNNCRYCSGNLSWRYPTMKFKVSTDDIFKKSAIIVEVNENRLRGALPADYWNFIPPDPQLEESFMKPHKRVLSHAQVHFLLKDVDPNLILKFVPREDSLFLNCFPVTPNSHRVTEVHAFNGQRLMFDERTRAYRKLVDFRGVANELGARVLDCLKISKLHAEKLSNTDLAYGAQKNIKDCPSKSSGLRWFKDVVLGKRSDHCFRMVVVGDPNIKLDEIGIPSSLAERLLVSEHLNRWNLKKLDTCLNMRVIEKGEIYVRRNGKLVRVRLTDELHIGDTIYRPLRDGDVVLINRPPSIHQHSLIALSAKILPVVATLSLNPLCCSPFRGDFDGDCLHGYIPQSVASRVELKELMSLDKQLINQQSGKNLLSLSHDSLTAAHLVMEDDVFLNLFQMQQLEMFTSRQELLPAIVKAPSVNRPVWTGKQLFSMILPPGFNYDFASDCVCIHGGELMSTSEGSSWLRDTNGNLFQSLVRYSGGNILDILHAAQGVLCEWLSMRGLSVSLLDLYLTGDSYLRKNLTDDVSYGLLEAEQTCAFKQLINYCQEYLTEDTEDWSSESLQEERLSYERQRCVALSQVSVDAFKQVFRDIQSLVFKYASKDNSLLAMFKAGSKGNLLKLAQQSMCLGLQNSLVPLSFRIPHQLSCATWNNQKGSGLTDESDNTPGFSKSYIPFGVVENSFITGLNPLECFAHSVTSRESSFSDHADLPGTLTRKLMFFMRDLHTAYDGTVRNAYGNQIVQFSYSTVKDSSDSLYSENVASGVVGVEPVGALSACALSEAAYSALDQPISLLETSPLLNLKNVLECGSKKGKASQTMSLFLSEKLGRRRYGYEYGALELKNHLEGVIFSDIVSSVRIIHNPETGRQTHFSPWVCHFHLSEKTLERRRLKVDSIIRSLYTGYNSTRQEVKYNLPNLKILSKDCSVSDKHSEENTRCIVVIFESPKKLPTPLDGVRDLLIPILLRIVIKGFKEIKKIDILWKDVPSMSKRVCGSSGELYLKVSMSGDIGSRRFWNMLMDDCIEVMDLIDWSRSHPDNINAFCWAYGIDAGWKYFLNNLESALSDAGKTILPEHLLLVANCLSVTGEFVGLNAKGISRQREIASVSSPFSQACFSTPSAYFIKAAKGEVEDGLQGSLDALAWGKVPSFGTGGPFELIYSGKGGEIDKPTNVYDLLGTQSSSDEQTATEVPNAEEDKIVISGAQFLSKCDACPSKALKKLNIPNYIKKFFKYNDIQNLSHTLKRILHKYPINEKLNETDKSILMMALHFHPQVDAKIGVGAQDIKVGHHENYQNTRCFILERKDGTFEDFSYHKCIDGALEIVAPSRVNKFHSRMLERDSDEAVDPTIDIN
ncbi:hypothetical protein UlMin_037106 [Ulmus minor]